MMMIVMMVITTYIEIYYVSGTVLGIFLMFYAHNLI